MLELIQQNCVDKNCTNKRQLVKSSLGNVYPRQYCKEHAGKQKRAYREVGSKFKDGNGYMVIKLGKGNYTGEHRFVMEKKLGRPLKKGESVHHKNGIRDDNRPDNLELWVGAIRYGQRATDIECPHCGKKYLEE